MPLGLAFHRWRLAALGVVLACSAPDGSDLYGPLPAGSGGAAGRAGSGGSSGSAGVASGGSSGSRSEGQGGALPLAGAAGSAGSRTGGESFEGDASVPDAGRDAAVEADAAPPPPACVPSTEVCDGLDNDCDGDADEGATCPNDCIGFALAGHGYMFCPEPADRGVASARCEAQSMKLAWLESEEETDALVLRITELGRASCRERVYACV